MFVSYQKNYAVPLVIFEHVYEVSSLYDIGKLGFQNPCFSTDSREIYLGAGKHPSPLDISESYSPDLYLKVGFYLIKK